MPRRTDPPSFAQPDHVLVLPETDFYTDWSSQGRVAALQYRRSRHSGGADRIAEILIAELGGDDVGRFASARHLASWVGVCPGQNESAGKQRSGTTRKGNRWLRSALVEAAYAAQRSKDTYLSAQFARIAARRGVKKPPLLWRTQSW